MPTMQQIKNRNRDLGQHFFDADTLRFFSSRISDAVFYTDTENLYYFVTSEQFKPLYGYPEARRYTIRSFDWNTGDVRTVGEFQDYADLKTAKAAAKSLAKQTKTLQAT